MYEYVGSKIVSVWVVLQLSASACVHRLRCLGAWVELGERMCGTSAGQVVQVSPFCLQLHSSVDECTAECANRL